MNPRFVKNEVKAVKTDTKRLVAVAFVRVAFTEFKFVFEIFVALKFVA